MASTASGSSGATATRNIVAANLIGLAPGGGYLFGTGNPGNGGDGVRIEDSADNQIGGPDVDLGQRDLVERRRWGLHHRRQRRPATPS